MNKTILTAINFGEKLLLECTSLPRIESEKLLIEVLQKNRLYIILNSEKIIDAQDFNVFQDLLFRRLNGEPIEYILEKANFYSEEFFVKKGVLIPRPETEILVDNALKLLKNLKSPKVLEIGIGSGIISTILGKELSDISIVGVDISDNALNIARQNISTFNLSSKIELRKSNLFEEVLDSDKFDMIISNPPYISNKEVGRLPKELGFEPDIALFGGDIGDEILHKLILYFFSKLDIKYLLCEIGFDQKDKIESFVSNRAILSFYKDLAGFDRGFILTKY